MPQIWDSVYIDENPVYCQNTPINLTPHIIAFKMVQKAKRSSV